MDLTHLPPKKRAFKPFNGASERFQRRAKSADAPGYNIYFQFLLLIYSRFEN
jgi:hypothetical protein